MTTTKNDSLMHYDHESRIVRVEVTIENINQTLNRMDKRLDNIEGDIKSNFKWMLTAIFGLYAGLIGVLLKGFGVFH